MTVASFQRRSATALTSLTLALHYVREDGPKMRTNDLTAILSLFPTIKSFRIDNLKSIVNPLLRALAWTTGREVILPKLADFWLNHTFDRYYLQPYPSELTPMVLSRWWPDRSDFGDDDDNKPSRL
ncbi:hypothetical protein BT96DRAFT_989547 [Gymnopus androsaceus JB14]|uniref:Uncharacterized protein n=1 Tax=Gymnopus androsaceus JB14 TaxID=1447944 RepID=A0A6A4HY16_9AGAR|nr:hypothetical protein BT96DRAFT_989547 [Gymnopus androsaceus JB14]